MKPIAGNGSVRFHYAEPDVAGHAEFSRECLAEINRLRAVNAELLAALQELLLAVNVDKVPGIGLATEKAQAAIAKATKD